MGRLCLLLVLLQLSWSFSSSVSPPSSSLCLPNQRDALLQFKNAININDILCTEFYPFFYPKTESWNKSTDCCSWPGVECDNRTGHVIGIDLSSSCLNGSLLANSSLLATPAACFACVDSDDSTLHTTISKALSRPNCLLGCLILDAQGFEMLVRNLTRLRNLMLDSVDMSGVAVSSFLNLSSSLRHLSLGDCRLHGEFPTPFFQFPNLKGIGLGGNEDLRSYLPMTNWSSGLELLDLSHCGFRGLIPPSFGNLSRLKSMDLSGNHLRGRIPDIFRNLGKLTYLGLSSCNLSGPVPDSVFSAVHLKELRLSSNNLSGVIVPGMLSKFSSLEVLDLSNNSLLSLGTSSKDANHSSPRIATVAFSSCSIRQFPSFFRTSKLEYLDLSNNMISGGISKWEAQGWEELVVLNLSYNLLTTLEQFPGKKLGILDLRSNMLQGPILSTCLNLRTPNQQLFNEFLISGNNLTGNIPSSICNWSELTVLDLSRNNLNGTIPECLGNFSNSLAFVDLQMNNFGGKIPDSFVNNSLTHLFLNNNQFEGLVPPSLANSKSLQLLNLGNNNLADKFPHWLASLPSLQVLILRSNRFYGPLTHSAASFDFSALRMIDLSGNEFTGTLPSKLFRNLRAMTVKPMETRLQPLVYRLGLHLVGIRDYHISVNVTTKRLEMELTKTLDIFVSMDLSYNRFRGRIPEEVGQLISLQMLNFSRNNFTGPIPASFGNMVALESLDLSSNKLNGRIPSQMTNLTFLAVLNLSSNNLVGSIPQGNQFGTFDNDSYSDNSGLCGLPLSRQCGNRGVAEPPAPLATEHEGSEVPFFWKVVMMGYGSGVVLGLSTGYIVFVTGRPWWLVRTVERGLQHIFANWIRRRRTRRN
ncbi:Receptor like protein 43 [Hibiscus syriacus]|uniref:Receptor like protein 43 n=1 Tax=Hibiscus syriacus TaxID=106335 RepID=A0A6A3BVT8_HIBSY|nr:receptor-like protein Cf-9 homolog [Hibiscus syriacus]KAE8720853.1 Receptor like protein 43 [Hibiscus syriacus]